MLHLRSRLFSWFSMLTLVISLGLSAFMAAEASADATEANATPVAAPIANVISPNYPIQNCHKLRWHISGCLPTKLYFSAHAQFA